jgi:hypothetical protein
MTECFHAIREGRSSFSGPNTGGGFFCSCPGCSCARSLCRVTNSLEHCGLGTARVNLLDGSLRLIFMNNVPSLAVTTIFGERFTAIQYGDVLIDPGPVFGSQRLERYLDKNASAIHAVVATHAHEEHIGNTALTARRTAAPVYGTGDRGSHSVSRGAFLCSANFHRSA